MCRDRSHNLNRRHEATARSPVSLLRTLTVLRSLSRWAANDPPVKLDTGRWRGNVTPPRAADDFATIRARMEELRREREGPQPTGSDLQRDPRSHRVRSLRWPLSEIGGRSGRLRQSGSGGG